MLPGSFSPPTFVDVVKLALKPLYYFLYVHD